jgi:hypothetical protein
VEAGCAELIDGERSEMVPQGKPFEQSENMACSTSATIYLLIYAPCTWSRCTETSRNLIATEQMNQNEELNNKV